jgi:hypothetical protein
MAARLVRCVSQTHGLTAMCFFIDCRGIYLGSNDIPAIKQTGRAFASGQLFLAALALILSKCVSLNLAAKFKSPVPVFERLGNLS